MIDCSHGNSQKVFHKQVDVAKDIVSVDQNGERLIRVLLRSQMVN